MQQLLPINSDYTSSRRLLGLPSQSVYALLHIIHCYLCRHNVPPVCLQKTPLFLACRSGHLAAAKVLMENGADVTVVDSLTRLNCLDVAVDNGHKYVYCPMHCCKLFLCGICLHSCHFVTFLYCAGTGMSKIQTWLMYVCVFVNVPTQPCWFTTSLVTGRSYLQGRCLGNHWLGPMGSSPSPSP